MAQMNGAKGNPASKRMMNAKLKEKRARSWAKGERRKLARVKAQEARHAENVATLKEIGYTGTKRASKLVRKAKRMHPDLFEHVTATK